MIAAFIGECFNFWTPKPALAGKMVSENAILRSDRYRPLTHSRDQQEMHDIVAWLSKLMQSLVSDAITHPYPNSNSGWS